MTKKKCEECGNFEATFTFTYGKFLDTTKHLCELCLMDYEYQCKNVDCPYKIDVIPEVVTFT